MAACYPGGSRVQILARETLFSGEFENGSQILCGYVDRNRLEKPHLKNFKYITVHFYACFWTINNLSFPLTFIKYTKLLKVYSCLPLFKSRQ